MRAVKVFLISLSLIISQAVDSQHRVDYWLTTNDGTLRLTHQMHLSFSECGKDTVASIRIDADKKYQSIDGFGFALTGGSAQLMLSMSPDARKKLISELFTTDGNHIGISYLRLSIGSSDLNDHTFSYDDVSPGMTDPGLKKFTLKEDEKEVIPILREILRVNPRIKILACPWSAPVWMKTNHNIQGGMLKLENYPVYARYFIKYIEGMKAHGIIIDAITVQNEPLNNGNTPSMQFFAKQELDFVKYNLGPAFETAGITTKIILYDHNCDAPEYPISILTDPAARKYVNGSGFHLYAGPMTALSKVHTAFPDKALYFTEMMVVSHNDFNVANAEERIVIGALRNWSRNVILWNLAADQYDKPHTDNGGCAFCQGAITIDGDSVSRNLAYYTIAHVSKFVPANSFRVQSTVLAKVANVAFETPDGKIVLMVANNTKTTQDFQINYKESCLKTTLPGQSVATYVW